MVKSLGFLFCMFITGYYPVFAQEATIAEAEIRKIYAEIEQGYNLDSASMVLKHYSPDIIVSYPGISDTDFNGFQVAYKKMMAAKTRKTVKAVLQEIIISGDVAVVRMQWHTTLFHADGKSTFRRAIDLQVFRREHGSWKLYRGIWYHEPPASGR